MISFLRLGDYGRLGNQLFQVAVTLAAAHRTGQRAVFPAWEFAAWLDVQTEPIESLEQVEWITHRPAGFAYDESIRELPAGGNVNLEGYFQSERYFDDRAEAVRAAVMSARMRALRDRVSAEHGIPVRNDWCGVHVRRGDYVKHSDLYVQLDVANYYLPAMAVMRQEHGARRFVIVSDDPGWCRRMFREPDVTFSRNTGTVRDRILNSQRHRNAAVALSRTWRNRLSEYGSERVLRDLMLMASCRTHIIANSSFSWWSSWLGHPADRAVIAPREWFTPALGHDTRDLYRPEMIRM